LLNKSDNIGLKLNDDNESDSDNYDNNAIVEEVDLDMEAVNVASDTDCLYMYMNEIEKKTGK